jgi:transposase
LNKGAHDRRPHNGCLCTHQDGISSNGEDRQERCQQFGRKADKDAAKERAENGDIESIKTKPKSMLPSKFGVIYLRKAVPRVVEKVGFLL